jgi:hypothetical protein
MDTQSCPDCGEPLDHITDWEKCDQCLGEEDNNHSACERCKDWGILEVTKMECPECNEVKYTQ